MFHGLSVAVAARRFLELKKTKQRMKDIVDGIQQGGIESSAGNFYSNVFTTLKRRKDFIRLGKFWALAEWHPTRVAAQEKPSKKTRKARKPASATPSVAAKGAGKAASVIATGSDNSKKEAASA